MIMLPPILKIEEAPPPKPTRNFKPELKWPSLDSSYSMIDLGRFPAVCEEVLRYSCGEFGVWSEGFESAVRNARSHVWLIDSFLLKVDQNAKSTFYDVFNLVLRNTAAQDIRLLTSNKSGHQKQISDLYTLQEERRAAPRYEAFTIKVRLVRGKKGQSRLPHDRFALIDDELWHWGANVGGTHHEVNAYSRGWPVCETRAKEYFERLWNSVEALS